MAAASLDALIRFCDRTLRTHAFTDWPGAVNGLQVQNSGRVTRLAAAVDARRTTVDLAIEAGADLLIVHHGLFWSAPQPWTGTHYQLLRRLLDHNLAVYSSHLPLDAHPRLGNSIQLARAVGLTAPKPFFETKGQPIGFRGKCRLDREALRTRLAEATGSSPILLPGGPQVCRAIGVVTGGAGAELRQAAEAGLDTFITGEGPHWTAALADDLGLNVFYAGHYATETFGVRALAAQVARRFRLPWDFIDYPTGL